MSFVDIATYMQLSRSARRAHLRLGSACIEIGGNSYAFRGLLAHARGTTLPAGNKIMCCHACNNDKCSNPDHLYWGTAKDNVQDMHECGHAKTIWTWTVIKHGDVNARSLVGSTEGRKRGGDVSAERRSLTAVEVVRRSEAIIAAGYPDYGWITRAAEKLHLSHTQIRRFVRRYAGSQFRVMRKSPRVDKR